MGLMSLFTGALESGTQTILDREDKIKTEIQEGVANEDLYKTNMIKNSIQELELLRNNNPASKYLNSEANFKRLLTYYGEDQIEELNMLAHAYPADFQGDYEDVKLKIGNLILSKSAPNITAKGDIFTPTDFGKSEILLSEDEGGGAYRDYTEQYGGASGADLFRKRYNEMRSSIQTGLSDTLGLNTANLYTSDFLNEGAAKDKYLSSGTYKDERGLDVTSKEQFNLELTEILNKKLFEQPSAITRGEIMQNTNWVAYANINDLKSGYLQEFRGNTIQADIAVYTTAIEWANEMYTRNMDPKSLLSSGVISSDTVVGALINDPIGAHSLSLYNDSLNNLETRSMVNIYESHKRDGTLNTPDGIAAKEKYNNHVTQMYDNARTDISETGFYGIRDEFLSVYDKASFENNPSLVFTADITDTTNDTIRKNVELVYYPIVVSGLVKILDINNLDPDNPEEYRDVKTLIPEWLGGYTQNNKDKNSLEYNLYYDKDFGYDEIADKNRKLDLAFSHFKRNDPFNLNLNLTDASENILKTQDAESIKEEVVEKKEDTDEGYITSISNIGMPPPQMITNPKGGKLSGRLINPEYTPWMDKNKEIWNRNLIWIKKQEPPKQIKAPTTGPGSGRLEATITNPKWKAWNDTYNEYLEIGTL